MSTTTADIGLFTDEQRDFRAAIRDFAQRECGTSEQRERLTNGYQDLHSQEIYEQLAELGWLGVSIDEAYGGSGGGMVDACIFLEETLRGLVPIAGYGVSLIVAGAYERFGTEEQKQEILGGITHGRVEAIAMSEPEAGSDVGNLSCRAERRNGGFVLNGQKTWISAAHIADHILVVARSDASGSKHDGLTMISVPADAEGIEIRGIQTMAGKEANDAVLAYIKERKEFGRPIGSFQTLKHRISARATEIECTRLLVYHVARKVDS